MLSLMRCEFCGHPLPEGARFCPNCGTPVSTTLGTEERKMVTVVFADLVDSTGLAQRLDPERAREVLGGSSMLRARSSGRSAAIRRSSSVTR